MSAEHPAAQGRKSSEGAWGTDENGVVGEGWPDGSGVLAGASDEEVGPVGNDGRASDPSAATGHSLWKSWAFDPAVVACRECRLPEGRTVDPEFVCRRCRRDEHHESGATVGAD